MNSSHLKSKKIADYFEIPLSSLKPSKKLTFNVLLYFKQNDHIMMFKKVDETISQAQLDSYFKKGVHTVWISKAEKLSYDQYVHAVGHPTTPPIPASRVEVSAQMASGAKSVIQHTLTSSTYSLQLKANAFANKAFGKILSLTVQDHVQAPTRTLLNDLWQTAQTSPHGSHSANVASYAALFAMAFGLTDPVLLANLSLAGLLHDIGLTQISLKITSQPWNTFSAEDVQEYSRHADEALLLIETFGEDIPQGVKDLIHHHHEKLNGKGYPRGVLGKDLDLASQVLILAETLDSISTGQWDGIQRSYPEALQVIEEQNPEPLIRLDLLTTVKGWIAQVALESAA